MKILVLAESLRINETSSGIVSSTFIKALLCGENEIICLYENSVNYPISWLEDINSIPVIYNLPKKYFFEYIPKIRAIPTYIYGYSRIFKNQIKSWELEINKQLNNNKFDLIISLGSGASFLPHYAMLNIITRTPWIANFHDPYPMSLYPEPYKSKSNIILKKQEYFVEQIMSKANYISFPSLYLKNWMSEFYSSINKKYLILPHIGIHLDNLPVCKIDKEINLDLSKFNLLHAGTLLGPRKVDFLFRAFNRLIENHPEIKSKTVLTILGKVAKEHKDIKEIILKNKANFNIITDRVSYKHSLEIIKESDVSIIIEANSNFSPFMPGKLSDLIYLKKTIFALTPENSETRRILGFNYLFLAKINDEETIYNKLIKLWNLWKEKKLKLPNESKLVKYISAKELNKKLNKLV